MSKADRTRQVIIEKAASIFNHKGYSGTSMNDIMDATGLTKGCIYGNFQNKDEIAIAAFDYNFSYVTSIMRVKILEKQSAIEKLLTYPDTYRDFIRIPFIAGGCPILNTSTEADDTHPALKKRAVSALKFWQTGVEKIIARGIEAKEIRSNTNGAEFAVILTSLIEGAVMQAKITGRSNELDVTMDFLEKLIKNLKA
ncbi:MAG: transcriptional regulator [Bacteroidetes bacterium]|jgi:AcrR family transcriptional regulator|nr:transcriptional regulator [Bacteroidota bacterium]